MATRRFTVLLSLTQTYSNQLPREHTTHAASKGTKHVNIATHKGGHTLDFVISRESSPIIVVSPSVFDPCLSNNKGKTFGDHLAVEFIINMKNPNCILRKIRYRKYHGIDIKEFIDELQSSQHLSNCEGSVHELVEVNNKGVQSIINHHSQSC